MASAKIIKNKIVTMLESLDSLKNVFGYATSNFNGNYPVANVTMLDGEGEIRANVRNLYTYRYRIDVFVQLGSVGFSPEDSESISIDLLDNILDLFNNAITLDGLVQYCMPISWSAEYMDRETDVRVLSVTLESKKLETTSV